MALDLEMAQPSTRIIQIGAVIGNIDTGEILDRFSMFINPEEQLSEYIINLTGITQEQVDNGVTLREAYDQLVEFHKQHKAFFNAIVWGKGDMDKLKKEMHEMYGEVSTANHWPFGRREIDVKTIWVSYRLSRGEPIQGGLARSMTKVGLKFEGRKHNAESDAEMTFSMYRAMLKILNPNRT